MSLNIKDHKLENPADGIPDVIFSFKNSVNFVLKRWWIFAIAGMIGGISGIVYHYTYKTEFKSRLIFVLDNESADGNSLNLINLAAQFGFKSASGRNIFSNENIFGVIKSRRIIESALLSVDTVNHKPYTFIENYLEISGKRKSNPSGISIHFPPGQLRSSFSYQQDSLLYKTYQEFNEKYLVTKQPDPTMKLYELSVLSNDETFTKRFTDKIIEKTNEYYIKILTARSQQLLNTLEGRVASIQGNLNSSISKAATLKDVNLNPAFSAGKVPVQKQQLNSEVYGKVYPEMFKYMELARLKFLNKIPLMHIIDGAEYPMQKIQFGKWNDVFLFSIFSILLVMSVMGLFHLFLNEKLYRLNIESATK